MTKTGGQMTRICALLLILLAITFPAEAESIDFPRLGPVTLIDPARPPSGVVIVFSDPADLHPISRASLRALSEAGQVVAVVDSHRYSASLESAKGGCIRASDDLLALKLKLFQQYRLSENSTTVLAGSGAGGALAYAVLAQSDPGQFSGAMAVQFNPELPGRVPLCAGAPYEKTPTGFRYLPVTSLNGFWRIATASPENAVLRPYAQHQKDVIFPLRPYDDFSSAVISVIADAVHPTEPGGKIEDLPLVLLPAEPHDQTMAVIYSGDGGWRDLDKKIGEELQKAHIPVVGVDTLRYFWHRQTPEMATAGLERIIGHFVKTWNTPDVLLIGYSFGADIIPFIVNRVKPAVRAHIRLISLLSLSRTADFEIHMSGWMGGAPSADALALAPELGKLDSAGVQCFFGEEEQAETGCTDASLAGAQIIKTSGGHHFDGDYGKMVRTILDGAIRRGAALKAGEGGMSGGK
jgi:type IV secretory pathway VirJ component